MTGITLSQVDPASMGGMVHFLAAAGLPTTDVDEPGRIFYRFDADTLLGYGALEGDGPDRLLRSVVVLADRRCMGVGRRLVAALEAEAARLGVERLHLLTNTAASFFRAAGYADADRASAPEPIASCCQFTALCPASAAYLVKSMPA